MDGIPGITPAGAGKTQIQTTDRGKGQGSPPQVRGKLSPQRRIISSARITPAGAGKTSANSITRPSTEDHPRRCGENDCFAISSTDVSGSPPQVRGKHFVHPCYLSAPGITPAGAGKTADAAATAKRHRDHPRRCGENTKSMEEIAVSLGSPPQVRGKH